MSERDPGHDLVWSVESCERIIGRTKFGREIIISLPDGAYSSVTGWRIDGQYFPSLETAKNFAQIHSDCLSGIHTLTPDEIRWLGEMEDCWRCEGNERGARGSFIRIAFQSGARIEIKAIGGDEKLMSGLAQKNNWSTEFDRFKKELWTAK